MKITLETAIAVAEGIAKLAKLFGGGQVDRMKAAYDKLKAAASTEWPADAPIPWSMIEEHADRIYARGQQIGLAIDADPVR